MKFYQEFQRSPSVETFYKLFLFDNSKAQALYQNSFLAIEKLGNFLEIACKHKNLNFLKFLNQQPLDVYNIEHAVRINDALYSNIPAYMWLKWPEGWEELQKNKNWPTVKILKESLGKSIEELCAGTLFYRDDKESDNAQAIYNLIDYSIVPNDEEKKYDFYPSVGEMIGIALQHLKPASVEALVDNDTPFSQKEALVGLIFATFKNYNRIFQDDINENPDYVKCYKALEDKLLVCKHFSCREFLDIIGREEMDNHYTSYYEEEGKRKVEEVAKKLQVEAEHAELKETFKGKATTRKALL